MSEESEEACLVNPKQQPGTIVASGMPYTDGIQTQTTSYQSGPQTSYQPQTMGRTSNQSNEFDSELIENNDEIILSQFHADAIKQVSR